MTRTELAEPSIDTLQGRVDCYQQDQATRYIREFKLLPDLQKGANGVLNILWQYARFNVLAPPAWLIREWHVQHSPALIKLLRRMERDKLIFIDRRQESVGERWYVGLIGEMPPLFASPEARQRPVLKLVKG